MSTIKSSSEHLVLNADGASKDIKFQANGVEKASISSAGVMTATSFAGDGSALTGGGKLLSITRYTVAGSGTYTVPAGITSIFIRTVAGGGGGTGGNITISEAGSGGGGGGYAEKLILSPAATYAYTVGAGGAGSPPSQAGNAGTATTIAGIAGGAGGAGGAVTGAGTNLAGSGGTPTGGDINVIGGNGAAGDYGDTGNYYGVGGSGGSSRFGDGGTCPRNQNGVLGTNGKFGGGGGGGASGNGTAGSGGSGYIEIWEYS